MKRKDKLNEIAKLVNDYYDAEFETFTPLDLERNMNRYVEEKYLSSDNNYKKLTLKNILILQSIENLLKKKIISEKDSNYLEQIYLEYIALKKEVGAILYDNLMNDKVNKIPDAIELRLEEIEDYFKYLGIDIEENFNCKEYTRKRKK